MNRLEKAVAACLEDFPLQYENPNGVLVTDYADGAGFLLSCWWPGRSEADAEAVEISVEFEKHDSFIETFNISGNVKAAIDRITVADLYNLYLQGKADVDCFVDDNGTFLTFALLPKGNMLVKEDYKPVCEVQDKFMQPEQFIDYTKQYFRLYAAR